MIVVGPPMLFIYRVLISELLRPHTVLIVNPAFGRNYLGEVDGVSYNSS